jgi:TM2 domain-containing membrane protein YozV
MEANKVEQLILLNATKLPPESIDMVRKRLIEVDDATMAQVMFAQLKDPTIALILSIVVGVYGVDRFYIGDIGLGVGKLLTCAGAFIWYLIDIFMIMDATRKKNLETVLIQLH